jgi:hypothetical protein
MTKRATKNAFPLLKRIRARISLGMKRALLLMAVLLFNASVLHLQAKDGHGNHAAPASGWSGYKGTPRTFYSYTPPSAGTTPKSAYAPVINSGTTAASGTLRDSYRRVTSDARMSKNWSSKIDQGVSSARTWSQGQSARVAQAKSALK